MRSDRLTFESCRQRAHLSALAKADGEVIAPEQGPALGERLFRRDGDIRAAEQLDRFSGPEHGARGLALVLIGSGGFLRLLERVKVHDPGGAIGEGQADRIERLDHGVGADLFDQPALRVVAQPGQLSRSSAEAEPGRSDGGGEVVAR